MVSYSIFKVSKDEFGFDLSSNKYFAGLIRRVSALVCSNALLMMLCTYYMKEVKRCKMSNSWERKYIAILGLKIEEINELIKTTNDKPVCEMLMIMQLAK